MLNGHLHGLISRLLDEYQIRTRDCEGLAMSFSVLSRSAKAPEARDWLGCSLAAGPSNAVMSRAPQRCICMAAVVVTAAVQKHTNHSWPNYHYIREDDVGKGTGRSSRKKDVLSPSMFPACSQAGLEASFRGLAGESRRGRSRRRCLDLVFSFCRWLLSCHS